MNNNDNFDCIIWGGYGGGNVGDELNLEIAINDMKKIFGDQIAILSSNPEYTAWLFPKEIIIPLFLKPIKYRWKLNDKIYFDVRYIKLLRNTLFKYWLHEQINNNIEGIKYITKCKLLYLSGGGYITDLFNLETILFPLIIANKENKKISTAPIGIGPFSDKWYVSYISKLLNNTFLKVRDTESFNLCNEMNVEAKIQKDDGFRFLEISNYKSCMRQERNGLTKIGVCIFFQHGSDIDISYWETWWIKLIRYLTNNNILLEGFCFHNNPYLDFYQTIRIFSKVGLDPRQVIAPYTDFRSAISNLCKYDLIITTRFHAAVIATSINKPCIAISTGSYYSTKMENAIYKNINGYAFNIINNSPEEVSKVIDQFLNTHNLEQ